MGRAKTGGVIRLFLKRMWQELRQINLEQSQKNSVSNLVSLRWRLDFCTVYFAKISCTSLPQSWYLDDWNCFLYLAIVEFYRNLRGFVELLYICGAVHKSWLIWEERLIYEKHMAKLEKIESCGAGNGQVEQIVMFKWYNILPQMATKLEYDFAARVSESRFCLHKEKCEIFPCLLRRRRWAAVNAETTCITSSPELQYDRLKRETISVRYRWKLAGRWAGSVLCSWITWNIAFRLSWNTNLSCYGKNPQQDLI